MNKTVIFVLLLIFVYAKNYFDAQRVQKAFPNPAQIECYVVKTAAR